MGTGNDFHSGCVNFPSENALYPFWQIHLFHRCQLTSRLGLKYHNIERHLIKIYVISGLLAGLVAMVAIACIKTAQAGMGMMYELDAISAAVIGGVSLSGGRGRILGTVIGALILGVMMSGFTCLRVDVFYQEIIKGTIIVLVVVIDQYRQSRRLKKKS